MLKTLKTIASFSLLLTLLMAPSSVSAQPVQNTGSELQNQSSNAQNTGSPIIGNNSAEALSQSQPQSLDVVGSPSQQTPSVTVGPANTKATSVEAAKSSNVPIIWFFLTVLVFLMVIYLAIKKQPAGTTKPYEPKKSVDKKVAKLEPAATKNKKKPVTKTGPKKKKKKRTHR